MKEDYFIYVLFYAMSSQCLRSAPPLWARRVHRPSAAFNAIKTAEPLLNFLRPLHVRSHLGLAAALVTVKVLEVCTTPLCRFSR
jgi:hypothetical protein